jgi:hypothetical protein
MNLNAIYAWLIFVGLIVFLVVMVSLLHFGLWRLRLWRGTKRGVNRSRIYSCCLGLGMAFLQVMWLFYRPSAAYILRVQEDEDADEDDEGDPECPTKQMNRQYKRIRRGEPIDRLVLRL